ncbi:MAG: phosphatidate cytidylyltransferase [Cyanobacteria bacterium J06649_11]
MSLSRVLSGIIAIALALGGTILGGWYFTLFYVIIIFLGQREYFNLVRAKGIAPAAKTTMVVSQVLLAICTIDSSLADAVMSSWYIHLFLPVISTENGINSRYFRFNSRFVLHRLFTFLLGTIASNRYR